MKKLSCIFGFIIYLIVGLIAALPVTASAATYVSGLITTDTTWTPSDSPYIVSGNVLVNSGVTLTIEPGVIVKFDSATGLQIEGTLIAIGTETDNIIFTSSQAAPAAGDWGNIFFADSSTDATYDASGNYTGGSILEYSVIEYGGSTDGALLMDDAHPFINYCTIMDNSTAGISADNLTGTLKIANSSISNNTSAAIYVYGGTSIISNNTISDNINNGINVRYGTATIISGNTISDNDTGIFVYDSTAIISDNSVNNNADIGISAVSSTATISDNIISDNAGSGLQVSGTTTISDNTISNNGNGIAVYSGTATISNNNISNNTTSGRGGGIYISDTGKAIISDNTIANNIAGWSGGGIYIDWYGSTKGYNSGSATIINNTITGNSAENASAVDYRTDSYDYRDFRNNIITGNTATGDAPTCTVLIQDSPFFNYNDIFNNIATYELCVSWYLDARLNWWGTSIEAEIQAKINDWLIVDYYPYLLSPDAEPEPDISVDIESWDFGNVDVQDSLNQLFTISNVGVAALDIGDLYLAGNNPDQFGIYNDNCSGMTIASLGSCTFKAAFSPTEGGALNALIGVNSNDPDTPLLNIGLSGIGVEIVTEPDISANPASSDFGSVDVGAGSAVAVFTVSNNGSVDLEISEASLAGANPDQFAITDDTCSGATLAPAENCIIDVVFSPTDAAEMSASLVINSNDPETPELNIGLSGTGVEIVTEPDISANPASSDFGSVDVGAGSAVVVFTVSNNGSADLEISGASLTGANPDEFVITGDTCSGAAVAPAESCTIDLVFSPIDAAEMSASLVINSNDPDTPELNIGLSGTGVDIADEYKGKGNGWRNGKN